MSNLSEDEIIKEIEEWQKYDINYTNLSEYDSKNLHNAIQGLLDLYQQEKEKNKELELDLEEMTKSNEHKKEHWVHKAVLNSYISKDKIREKIKEYDGLKEMDLQAYEEQIKPLLELLEEE